jgi:hypothetical protein
MYEVIAGFWPSCPGSRQHVMQHQHDHGRAHTSTDTDGGAVVEVWVRLADRAAGTIPAHQRMAAPAILQTFGVTLQGGGSFVSLPVRGGKA